MKQEFKTPKPCGFLLAAAAVFAVSALCLRAADAPVNESRIAKVLPWIGARSPGTPGKLMPQKGDVIVAIGDSITQAGGYLRDIDAALAGLYPALQLPALINTGISGQKAEDLVGRFQQDVVSRKPAVVTISIGINDVWHRLGAPHAENVLKAYKDNVTKMVDMAQTNGIKVILLAPTLIQENPADVQGNWLTSDGVHMSPLGDAVMAAGVLRALGIPDRTLAKTK